MDSKPWYTSKTLWAGVLTTLVGILTALKIVHIGPIQVENIAAESEGLSQTIVGLVEMFLGLVTVLGRLTSKTTLSR